MKGGPARYANRAGPRPWQRCLLHHGCGFIRQGLGLGVIGLDLGVPGLLELGLASGDLDARLLALLLEDGVEGLLAGLGFGDRHLGDQRLGLGNHVPGHLGHWF